MAKVTLHRCVCDLCGSSVEIPAQRQKLPEHWERVRVPKRVTVGKGRGKKRTTQVVTKITTQDACPVCLEKLTDEVEKLAPPAPAGKKPRRES